MTDRTEARARTLSLAAIILAGAALRLWQYLGNASLWIDEIALAENVLHRSLGTLLARPLAYDQVAPPGFLAALKAATAAFGTSERALRLVPLLCSLASLPLFAALARRVLGGWTAIFATGLFASGTAFIRHGGEVKHYSSDVLIAILMTLLALRLVDASPRPAVWLVGLTGAVAGFFSQPAVLVLTGLGSALAWTALQGAGPRGLRQLVPTLALWAAGAVAATAMSLHRLTPETRAYLGHFWEPAFPPLPPRSLADWRWLPRALFDFWRSPGLGYPWPGVFLGLAILGAIALWKRRRAAGLLLLAPVAATLAAAVARLYPFGGRVILFLAPAFLLFAASGARVVAEELARSRARVPRALTATLLVLPPALALASDHPVRFHEETRPLLERLAADRRPDDAIYVYYGARMAFGFYAPRTGVDPSGALLGACHRDDPRAYLREIDALRSRPRVWVLFAHAVAGFAEQPLIRGYLAEIGRRRQSYETRGAALDLYDLSDPARLAAGSAEAFPVPAPDTRLVAWLGCDAGPHAAGPVTMPGTPP